MKEFLEFEISDANVEKLIDGSTCLCLFRIITEGQNKHEIPMSLDVIKEAAERTLRGKPILASYSNWHRDLESHKVAEDSEAIGYFIENQEFQYKEVENGKIALFAKGLLWKRYAPKQVGSLFSADEHTKKVSMEIKINSLIDKDDSSKGIKSFDFLGVAILGDRFSEASENACATLLTFSEMKDKYETMLFASKSRLIIDNSKESAFMSEEKFSGGRSLYSKVIDQPNAEYFVKELYLEVEPQWFDSLSTKLVAPHHKWRGNVLCLSRVGLETSADYLRSKGITSGERVEHLRRHFSELGLSMGVDFEKKEDETLEEKVMMEDVKEEVMAVPEPEKEEEKEPEKEEEKFEQEEEKEEEIDYSAKIAEYEAKIEEFACSVKNYEAELGELRKYKADREDQDKKFQVEKLFSEVGDSLPKEKAEEFRTEAESLLFSEFAAFSNKVKACTFDVVKKNPEKDATPIMAVNLPTKEVKKSVWGL